MESDDLLEREVRQLGNMLGETIAELAGPASLELVEEIRKLARERRRGGAEAGAQLADRIARLTLEEGRVLARAFSIFFDLVNVAEDRHRVRILRSREAAHYPEPRTESIAAAVARLKASGCTAEKFAQVLNELSIDLVFTAHPSEAKRRTIRTKLRTIRRTLQALDNLDLLPRERDRLLETVRDELTILWQTDFLRPWRPTVMQEVARGLSFTATLWETVPTILGDLRRAAAENFPGETVPIPPVIRFGSWMGGDRDGNPHVTTEITEQTLQLLRKTALQHHLHECQRLYESLSLSERENDVGAELTDALAAATARWPKLAKLLESVSPHEVYRRWLTMIQFRLGETVAETLLRQPTVGAYAAVADFEADVRVLADSLRTHHDARLADGEPQRWLDRIAVFGFHLARLDIRQDSRRYVNVMNEVLAALNICPNYAELGEAERQQLLTQSMGCSQALDVAKLTDLAQDTVKLFRLLRREVADSGEHVIGGHVVSMTHQPSDLLTVMWLWEWAGAAYETELGEATAAALRVIPLFETIDDLQRAPTILEGLLDQPAFAPYLEHAGRRLIVMIGYSDSTKDGGYLSACWRLYRAQSELCDIAERRNVRLTFFHGRGGSLGRGGGPAARSILSLPPKALGGSLRTTEQGEVLAERYDDPQIAYRHLEQMTWAMLLSAAGSAPEIPETWRNVMDKLATRSYKAYREFVEQPSFIDYFAQGTPIEEIENLPIASRPARRGERRLEDLRAIPWVFSWTQNRCMIPAWYGLGSALEEMQLAGGDDWRVTLEMYRQWPFFQATIDNAILALAKTDLYVGQRYATLVESPELRQRIFAMIAAEHERSRRNILAIVGGTDLLSNTPWLQRSIEFRNPYVDPLNLIQVEWFRRLRSGTETIDASAVHDLLRLTVQGIAAGVRTTG